MAEPCGVGAAHRHYAIGWTVSPKGFSGLLRGVYQGKKLIPIGRVGPRFARKLLDWLSRSWRPGLR